VRLRLRRVVATAGISVALSGIGLATFASPASAAYQWVNSGVTYSSRSACDAKANEFYNAGIIGQCRGPYSGRFQLWLWLDR
jgi:hypothetical protein